MNIREVPVSELPALEAAALAFYGSSRFLHEFRIEHFIELWTAFISSGAGVILTDAPPGAIGGLIGGMVHRDIYGSALIAEEFFWFAEPEARGAGVRLYRAFEAWARRRGAAHVQMCHLFDVMPEKVARFYLREGFVPIEMRYEKRLCA